MKMSNIYNILIVIFTLAFPMEGSAQVNNHPNAKEKYCTDYSFAFGYVIRLRGVESPQQALKDYERNFNKSVLPKSDLKTLVNAIYFDHQLAMIDPGDTSAMSYIYNDCLRDWKPEHDWKPLK